MFTSFHSRVAARASAFFVAGISTCLMSASAPSNNVTITRDTYGVPYVVADTAEAAYYGLGFASAQDRLFQMYYYRLIARGQTAEFLLPTPPNPETTAYINAKAAYIESD